MYVHIPVNSYRRQFGKIVDLTVLPGLPTPRYLLRGRPVEGLRSSSSDLLRVLAGDGVVYEAVRMGHSPG
jgi:hypothetical protein